MEDDKHTHKGRALKLACHVVAATKRGVTHFLSHSACSAAAEVDAAAVLMGARSAVDTSSAHASTQAYAQSREHPPTKKNKNGERVAASCGGANVTADMSHARPEHGSGRQAGSVHALMAERRRAIVRSAISWDCVIDQVLAGCQPNCGVSLWCVGCRWFCGAVCGRRVRAGRWPRCFGCQLWSLW